MDRRGGIGICSVTIPFEIDGGAGPAVSCRCPHLERDILPSCRSVTTGRPGRHPGRGFFTTRPDPDPDPTPARLDKLENNGRINLSTTNKERSS